MILIFTRPLVIFHQISRRDIYAICIVIHIVVNCKLLSLLRGNLSEIIHTPAVSMTMELSHALSSSYNYINNRHSLLLRLMITLLYTFSLLSL